MQLAASNIPDADRDRMKSLIRIKIDHSAADSIEQIAKGLRVNSRSPRTKNKPQEEILMVKSLKSMGNGFD